MRQNLLNRVSHLAIGRFASSELFKRVVLIYELVDRHETPTNSDYQVVLDAFHDNLFLKVVVRSIGQPHEETLHSLLWFAFVDELS